MPLINIKCKECGKKEERLVSISKVSDVQYCDCKGEMERFYTPGSAPAAIYKGTGFYSTDYKSVKNQQDKINYLAGD